MFWVQLVLCMKIIVGCEVGVLVLFIGLQYLVQIILVLCEDGIWMIFGVIQLCVMQVGFMVLVSLCGVLLVVFCIVSWLNMQGDECSMVSCWLFGDSVNLFMFWYWVIWFSLLFVVGMWYMLQLYGVMWLECRQNQWLFVFNCGWLSLYWFEVSGFVLLFSGLVQSCEQLVCLFRYYSVWLFFSQLKLLKFQLIQVLLCRCCWFISV